MKIGDVSGIFGTKFFHTDRVKEGTVFMGLFTLFGILNEALKCLECGDNMTFHVDMKSFSRYIGMQCCSTECEWKYCFHTSKKQGPSYKVNVEQSWLLARLVVNTIHNLVKMTFTKLMNMPPPPTCQNFIKIQNKNLLPVVKQLANDSMINNAMNAEDACGNDRGECGISLMVLGKEEAMYPTRKCLVSEIISDKCKACPKWKKKK